jgi:lysozyme
MPVPGFNGVIDISHYQGIPSRQSLSDAGIVGVIHKATEGGGSKDATYFAKKDKIKKQYGLKWGSFHYSSGTDPLMQVENYLNYAKPEADEFIALDYEPSSSGTNMTYNQMVEFVELIHQSLNRYPVIYGGRLLRDTLAGVTESVLSKCPLWYSRYAPAPIGIPKIWTTWTLWQYTDGNDGPDPHDVDGFGHCDRDTYQGTEQDLLTKWPLS